MMKILTQLKSTLSCPHEQDVQPQSMVCGLVLSHGIERIAGPENTNFLCGKCQSQWVDGKPPMEPTPILLEIIHPETAVFVPTWEPVEPPDDVFIHPRSECFYLGARVNKETCGCSRDHSRRCAHPRLQIYPFTTLRNCQECSFWEEI